jgi:glycolate oxidase FAD binding subunit
MRGRVGTETGRGKEAETGRDGVTMALVEEPGDYEAVARILKKASDQRGGVIPRGGSTMLELGAPAPQPGIVVSLKNLGRVLDHHPANLTVRTQAGITLGSLNQTLAPHGQYLPLDPPIPDRATVGGILATNASGSLRVRFGSARDQLIGLRVALADGQLVHGGGDVVKNVAGYDLPKLFIGSMGTLGIIVEATFKISPLPSKTATIVAGFDTVQGACDVALRVLRSPMLPYGVEILNPAASAQVGLAGRFACFGRFGGLAGAVAQQLDEVEGWSSAGGAVTVAVIDSDAELWARLRDSIFEKTTVVKIGVVPTRIAQVAAQAQNLAESSGLGLTLLAHAVGILYLALDGNPGFLAGAVTSLRGVAAAHGGHLIVQHAPHEQLEGVDVWGPEQPAFGLMRKLKQELDPSGILNRGRFVGGI